MFQNLSLAPVCEKVIQEHLPAVRQSLHLPDSISIETNVMDIPYDPSRSTGWMHRLDRVPPFTQFQVCLFANNIVVRWKDFRNRFDYTFEEYTLFILAHEMMHIQQVIEGRILARKYHPESYEEFLANIERYESQPDEKEANDFAHAYIQQLRERKKT